MRTLQRTAPGLTAAALALSSMMAAAGANASDAGWEVCSLVYLKGAADPSCNYRTHAQCQAAISGLGGSCFDNPYRKPASKPPAKKSSRQ